MLSVISRLSSAEGSGTTSIVTTSTTETAASRSVWRSSLRTPGLLTTRASRSAAPGDPVDEGEHPRDRGVELLRDHLADLDRGVQRARQRRVADTGTSFSSAMRLICAAIRSLPLATTSGAVRVPS